MEILDAYERNFTDKDQCECIIKYTDIKNKSVTITKSGNSTELSIVDPIKAKQYYEQLVVNKKYNQIEKAVIKKKK